MARYYTEAGTSLLPIAAALLDYYGAYHVDTNPNGVILHVSTSANLIFECRKISDKFIQFTVSSTIIRSWYGDSYSGGILISSVNWGGSSTTGTGTDYILVLTDNVFLLNFFAATQLRKLFLIGKLSNGVFAVLGLGGSTSYSSLCVGYLTDTTTRISVTSLYGNFKSSNNKLYKYPLMITVGDTVQIEEGMPVTFLDVFNCSRIRATATIKGSNHFISSGTLYDHDGTMVLYNGLLIEDIE